MAELQLMLLQLQYSAALSFTCALVSKEVEIIKAAAAHLIMPTHIHLLPT